MKRMEGKVAFQPSDARDCRELVSLHLDVEAQVSFSYSMASLDLMSRIELSRMDGGGRRCGSWSRMPLLRVNVSVHGVRLRGARRFR